ncbi:unnamed protein product [Rotaria magnacalcarata]
MTSRIQLQIIDDCNKNDLQQQQNNSTKNNINNNNKQTFKRQLTSSSQLGGSISNEEDDQFVFVGNRNKRKQRRTRGNNEPENNDDDVLYIDNVHPTTTNTNVANGRIFLNSKSKTTNNINRNENSYSCQMNHMCKQNQQDENIGNKNNETRMDFEHHQKPKNININKNKNYNDNSTNNNQCDDLNIPISHHALAYAVENQLPPIKISCQPKINQSQQGKEIIKALFEYIEKNFRKLNKNYQHPLGFDYWYTNKNGDLICFTKHTELFVYLSDPLKYPESLCNTILSPSKPHHLPAKHSIILKHVPNYINLDEIKSEIELVYKSIYNIEEMKGSMNEKSRHVRLEITSTDDYESLLIKGGITIDGHLIETQEFLSPPRILLCSKCNDPGHIRRNCNFQYDACRRCGKDRNIGEHKECSICCHRCNQEHQATDYKCPYLIDYRRSLIYKLKNQPNLLPPNIQLFIPKEYKEQGVRGNRILSNPSAKNNHSLINNNIPAQFNLSSHIWPTLNKIPERNNSYINNEQSIWNELKSKYDETNQTNNDIKDKLQLFKTKYDDHIQKMSSLLLVISQQAKIQNESIERCYTTLNEIFPVLKSTVEVFQHIMKKSGMLNITEPNNPEGQSILNHISQSLDFIENKHEFLTNSEKILYSLIEQQNVLMAQGINSLITNNDQ